MAAVSSTPYPSQFVTDVLPIGPAFDHKIKRSAVRDGLNLISIPLSMVMAGTARLPACGAFDMHTVCPNK